MLLSDTQKAIQKRLSREFDIPSERERVGGVVCVEVSRHNDYIMFAGAFTILGESSSDV